MAATLNKEVLYGPSLKGLRAGFPNDAGPDVEPAPPINKGAYLMSYGDVGGPVTELVLTCQAKLGKAERMTAGQPVGLCGPFTVTGDLEKYNDVFGQLLTDVDSDGAAIPVKVRGVCVFDYQNDEDGEPPQIQEGVCFGDQYGKVMIGGSGTVLKVDADAKQVHVLL